MLVDDLGLCQIRRPGLETRSRYNEPLRVPFAIWELGPIVMLKLGMQRATADSNFGKQAPLP